MKGFRFFAVLIVAVSAANGHADLIDDFEDGVINSDLWWHHDGVYYDPRGTEGWGEVYEADGQLVLYSQDTARWGAGIAVATLRETPLDARIDFSFELTIEDDTLDGSYISNVWFAVGNNPNAGVPPLPGWDGFVTVHGIFHDQQTYSNHVTGEYYFYLDSAAEMASLYDAADDSLLGSADYSSLGTSTPYLSFLAGTDTFNGAVYKTFRLNEISVVPASPALLLGLIGIGTAGCRLRSKTPKRRN